MTKKRKRKDVGDTIDTITEKTGVKKIVKWIAGEDCGCDKRRQKLNFWKYKTAKCLTEDEYNYLKKFFVRERKTQVTHTEQVVIINIYNRVFDEAQEVSNCGPCVHKIESDLRKVFSAY